MALVPGASAPKRRSIRLLETASAVARKGKTRKLIDKNLTGFRYAEQLYGDDGFSLPSGPRASDPLQSLQEERLLVLLPPDLRNAFMRMPPDARAEFLSRHRDLL
ncbi:hypothetical protein [Streptomyces blattellae]|uniref:hypothetical protein n=1 Tax=Streptomyces blattellae TaxID=2569855 RepID=UPI0012B8282D|nr:hypothetical protein [Streptomyces blattellae]